MTKERERRCREVSSFLLCMRSNWRVCGVRTPEAHVEKETREYIWKRDRRRETEVRFKSRLVSVESSAAAAAFCMMKRQKHLFLYNDIFSSRAQRRDIETTVERTCCCQANMENREASVSAIVKEKKKEIQQRRVQIETFFTS